MSRHSTAIAHVESLLWLLKQFDPQGIELYEHQYHPQSFGSFVLVIGRGHMRAKYNWDGKEFVLSVSCASFPNKNAANVPWTHDANISVPNGDGLFQEIASDAQNTLAI